jgi:hypothetical protein
MEQSPSALDGIPGVLEETALYEVANLAETACGRLEMCALCLYGQLHLGAAGLRFNGLCSLQSRQSSGAGYHYARQALLLDRVPCPQRLSGVTLNSWKTVSFTVLALACICECEDS